MRKDLKKLLYSEFRDVTLNTPNHAVPNGPVCGNGDIGVTMDLTEKGVRFWLSKNDFWCYRPAHRGGGMKSPAFITLNASLKDSAPVMWEDASEGRIGLRYDGGGVSAEIEAFSPRDRGMVIIRLRCLSGHISFEADTDTLSADPLCSVRREVRGGKKLVVKSYTGDNVEIESAAATAFSGCGNGLCGKLSAGESVCFAAAVSTENESEDPSAAALASVSSVAAGVPEKLEEENKRWWEDFWSVSDICIPDMPVIERSWYFSHYIMACCSERGKFAPGIFGNFITSDEPSWGGDYHLNYNHEAPFWGLYSSNHIDIADAYDRPLLEYIPTAEDNARRLLGCRGLYSKVGIGPKGYEASFMYNTDGTPNEIAPFWGQKSNAVYGGINFIMRYYHTLDRDYLEEKAYPYLIKVIDFWEDYLVFENGRYVDKNDCIHENVAAGKGVFDWSEGSPDYSGDTNPIVSLGLIRTTLKALLDMSGTLGRDADRREKWRHMLTHLSGYPTQTREGRTVFRYTEEGMDWCPGNSLGIQHIFPAGDIGLDSDPDLLKIARDTHAVLNRWEDYNAFPTFFTAAARLGLDPDEITSNMERQIDKHGYQNGFIYYGGGGIECCSAVPSTINDMFVQNYAGRLRIFPVWDRAHDASFRGLRTYGALLVSASLKDGRVSDVSVISEKGGEIRLLPPWDGGTVVSRKGSRTDTRIDGGDVIFNAEAGVEYQIYEDRS